MDIVIGLQYGDEGKGKVINSLIKKNKYTHCVRFNGGPNAGHTIYVNNKKLTTHQIPTGIVKEMTCLIGTNCVIDIKKLEEEIEYLEKNGIRNITDNLKIARNAHIILDKHINEDKSSDTIGSTGCGIRPTYRDKYDRCGLRADSFEGSICGCEIVDPYKLLNTSETNGNNKILFEGAQGFMLDIDWGNYPYVTSSSCLSSGITTCGVSFRNVENIYGVAKIYNTYVGKKDFQPKDNIFSELQNIGNEVGATTGRSRQCDWLNLDDLKKALIINGVNILIINKCDIIKQLAVYKLYHHDIIITFNTFSAMENYINSFLEKELDININVFYSFNKEDI